MSSSQDDVEFARMMREPLKNFAADKAAWQQYLARFQTTRISWEDQVDFLELLHMHETSHHKIFPTTLSYALEMRARVRADLQHVDRLIQSILMDTKAAETPCGVAGDTPETASATTSTSIPHHRSRSRSPSSSSRPRDIHNISKKRKIKKGSTGRSRNNDQ